MKRFVLAIIAITCMGLFAACFQRQGKEDTKQIVNDADDSVAEDDGFRIEPLSDKDIYFKPDTVTQDNPVVNDMIDVANGYAILRAAYCDAELWFRFGGVVNDTIKLLQTSVIRDKGVRAAAEQYVKTLVDILPRDTALWNESDSLLWEKVWDASRTFAYKLSSRFALSRYGTITRKDAERYMDIRQFIPDYDSIYSLRKEQTEENERYLRMMAEQTSSFDKQCLYTVEYAHQRRHDHPQEAIAMLEALMTSGKCSRYFHEVWRTWRVLRQLAESPSRDGMILNLEYNQMRFVCLNSILKQIVRNPKDIMAINDFCYLATYDNITRYSEFVFGNSASLEHMMLFPELLEESEESE